MNNGNQNNQHRKRSFYGSIDMQMSTQKIDNDNNIINIPNMDTNMVSDQGVIPPSYPLFPSYRGVILVLLLLGSLLVGLNQFTLGFTLACMVRVNSTNSSTGGFSGTYNWDRSVQSNVLASEEWGAIPFVFLVGWSLDRFGAKWLYATGVLTVGVISLLMPLAAAKGGWGWFLALRLLQGIGMEVAWPAVFWVTTRWFAAKTEAGLASSVAMCGFQIAAIMAMFISSLFCQNQSIGWEGMYYFVGVASLIGGLIWIVLYSDHIEQPRFISAQEVNYLTRFRSIKENADTTGSVGEGHRDVGTPWFRLLTSVPVWALIVCNFTGFYTFYFVGGFLPTYFKEILQLPVINSGVYAAIPSLAQMAAQVLAGYLSDRVPNWWGGHYRLARQNNLVKIFATTAGLLPAILIAAIPSVPPGSSRTVGGIVTMLSLASFFNGFTIGGHMRSMYLLSPRQTGVLSGLCATAMYASGIICAYVTGALVPKEGVVAEWNVAFYVNAAMSAFGALVFLVFGSGEKQNWAEL